MSCLFDSLSYFLHYDSNSIRQVICNYLQDNQPIIDGLETKFILDLDDSNYVNNMRKMSQWGGAIEIQAACNIFNAKITVYKIIGKHSVIEFLPINNDYRRDMKITWNGYHYEPVRI